MSMAPIVFNVELFGTRTKEDRKRSQKCLLWMMEALSQINGLWIINNDDVPLLYDSGVQYKAESHQENWQDIPHILDNGEGDCEDLACWRIAELRKVAGIRAMPFISWRRINDSLRYHALVRWPDGKVEDPSLALGMHGTMHRRPMFIDI